MQKDIKITFQKAVKGAELPSAAQVRTWAQAACQHPADITVRVVDEAEGLALNASYRGKAYATNVLTFDYCVEPVTEADIVLCAPVVAREAAEQHKPLLQHYAHLVVHGCLHAQGHDHETNERDAFEMEALESWLMLGVLGLPDPYAAHAAHKEKP